MNDEEFLASFDALLNEAFSFKIVSLVPSGIILISALIALFGIFRARDTARKSATLSLIEKFETTPHYREMARVFRYHRVKRTLNTLHSPEEGKDREDRTKVQDYLNHYELIAIGIVTNILDAKTYRLWMESAFIRDWNEAADYIQRERWKFDKLRNEWEYQHSLYQNFQKIALRWNPAVKHIDETSSLPPENPQGPGDRSLTVNEEHSL